MEHLKQEGLAQVATDKFTGDVSDILIDSRASGPDTVAATYASPLPAQIALQLFRADLPVSTSRTPHDDCQQNHRGPDFDDPGVRDDGDLLWPKH